MSILRALQILATAIPRTFHRHGFGVQSPSDYELVRDVLFEPHHYYAYADLGLHTHSERQLWRIRNHYRNVVVISDIGTMAQAQYEQAISSSPAAIVIEHIDSGNAALWQQIVLDNRATLTFDIRKRGLIVINPKRVKQNYLL